MDEVICGDCLEVMRGFKDKQFSAVITDPPYGLDFSGEDWDAFIPQWLGEARRVAEVVIFATAPTTMWNYPRPDWVCCWYREAAQSRSTLKGGFNHWTPILIYGTPKFQVDSIKLHAIQHATYNGHPSPKPLELMKWLIGGQERGFANILDTFMGSGTTLVAAKYLNRNATGIEISPKYCEIARKRLSQEQLF